MASCNSIFNRGHIIKWNLKLYHRNNVLLESNIKFDHFCDPNHNLNHEAIIFQNGETFMNSKLLCDSLGGEFPTSFNSMIHFRESYLNNSRFYNFSSCLLDDLPFYWTGIEYKNENWIDIYTKRSLNWTPVFSGEFGPNVNCTIALNGKLHPKSCSSSIPCSYCQLPLFKTYLILKGLCVSDFNEFDTQYYALGYLNDKIVFHGLKFSWIYFDSNDGRWTIQSLRNPQKISKLINDGSTDGTPIGRQNWITIGNGICDLESDSKHVLTLTNCSPDQFSCDAGDCIQRSSKCDRNFDCLHDQSDERYCPTNDNNLPLIEAVISEEVDEEDHNEYRNDIQININISIASIRVPKDGIINLNYKLNYQWVNPDPLRFVDLNNKPPLSLHISDNQDLWTPKLTSKSKEGQMMNAASASGMINLKNGYYLPLNLTEPTESEFYIVLFVFSYAC